MSIKGDVRRNILSKVKMGEIYVEVGVWKGNFTEDILEVCRPRRVYLIDPWRSVPSYNDAWYSCLQQDMDTIYNSVVERFVDRKEVRILREDSFSAARHLANESADFIYIDGDHNFEQVVEDINIYFPKLKPGGLLVCDDYRMGGWWNDGVIKAVDMFSDPDLKSKTVVGTQAILERR